MSLIADATYADSGGEPSVLVVDDDASLRELIALVVGSGGNRPLCAESVPEALELLERERVDLVLTDLNMPGLGGLDLLATVCRRARARTCSTTGSRARWRSRAVRRSWSSRRRRGSRTVIPSTTTGGRAPTGRPRSLQRKLRTAGVEHLFRLYPGGHTSALWQAHAPAWLGLAVDSLA